ncbi:hypothetical protein [Saccharothrix stipae]
MRLSRGTSAAAHLPLDVASLTFGTVTGTPGARGPRAVGSTENE